MNTTTAERFLRLHLRMLSHQYLSLDTSRMTALYFCVVGLDVLGALTSKERAGLIDWIYKHQVPGGFMGPHIAMTYSALASLVTLGDDLSRVDRSGVATELARLRRGDGSYAPSDGCECDVRFSYCAAAISKLLGIDVDVRDFVDKCRSYDGGFALAPGGESHGGSTYCCVAALLLTGVTPGPSVVDWCARRQHGGGLCGRPNKPPDSCYSFWIGAALRAMEVDVLDDGAVTRFVLACENHLVGGFAKFADDAPPDLLHSFYSLCWLSWHDQRLNAIDPLLGICARHTNIVR